MPRRIAAFALFVGLIGTSHAGAAVPKVKATLSRTWSPSPVVITKGDQVIFSNPTSEVHDFKPYKGPWSNKTKIWLYEGDSVKKRFRKQGRYHYRCTLHSVMTDGICEGMCGLVRAKGA
ncbi:MAG: hypothetical protein ACLGHL_09855 [Actinomycetota bacterium]